MKNILRILIYVLLAVAFLSCRNSVRNDKPVKDDLDEGFLVTSYQNPVLRNNCPDPSVLDDRERTGYFYVYSTQNGTSDTETVVYLPVYRSKDMCKWELVGNAFGGMQRPQWVANTRIWAPDIEYDKTNDRYLLYYAEGSWGTPALSAVGVAVSNSPTGPFTWDNIQSLNPRAGENGMLVDYATQGVTNCIDANIIRDVQSGIPYLFWGSFGSTAGVWAIELTDDGLAIAPGAEKVYIAYEMEGTYIHYKNGYYYCFGSKGSCCDGSSSTYHIVVGRSQNILGPYQGKDGKYMNTKSNAFDNATNTVLSNPTDLYFAGVGHNSEIITDDADQDWMFYHAYWKTDGYSGRLLNMDRVQWADGWPYFKGGKPSEARIEGPKLINEKTIAP